MASRKKKIQKIIFENILPSSFLNTIQRAYHEPSRFIDAMETGL